MAEKEWRIGEKNAILQYIVSTMQKQPILNIAHILLDSAANGPGRRDVIWLQGCSIGCPGCFNQQLWSYEPKHLIPVDSLLGKLANRIDQVEGITITGGEPMEQVEALVHLLDGVKNLGLSTFVYTGFTLEYLQSRKQAAINEALKLIDLLVDGPYVAAKTTDTLPWRGSQNQQIHFLTERYNDCCLQTQAVRREHQVFVQQSEVQVVKTGIIENKE